MKNETQNTIGNRIKEARERAGLLQSDLAKEVGFASPTAISLIENDERKVNAEVLGKIADALHVDVNDLLGKEVKKADFMYALRADKDLTNNDREKIKDFYNFIKNKK
jgi:transcriptional regulator with XRE-family HTH domain